MMPPMSDHDTWNRFTAYATARSIVAENPALLTAVVRGATQGNADAMQKLKEDLAWANMSVTAALAMATKRITPETRELLEKCLVKRFESFGSNTSQFEREFLAEKREKAAEPTPPQPDDDGWIKHDGMTVPVEPCTIVDAQDADGFVWEDVIVGEDGCVRDVFWLWNTPRGEDVAPHLRIAKYRVSGSGRIVSEAGVTK